MIMQVNSMMTFELGLYYDGSPLIVVNGQVVAQGSQFSKRPVLIMAQDSTDVVMQFLGLQDVNVLTATIDIEEVRSYRSAASHGHQSTRGPIYQRLETPFPLGDIDSDFDLDVAPTLPVSLRIHKPEEEIALSAGCWLWDYLRRSGAAGFLIPLSGGLDSCSTFYIIQKQLTPH